MQSAEDQVTGLGRGQGADAEGLAQPAAGVLDQIEDPGLGVVQRRQQQPHAVSARDVPREVEPPCGPRALADEGVGRRKKMLARLGGDTLIIKAAGVALSETGAASLGTMLKSKEGLLSTSNSPLRSKISPLGGSMLCSLILLLRDKTK